MGVLLAGTTACSGDPAGTPEPGPGSTSTSPGTTPSGEPVLVQPQLTAAQVVDGLTNAGYSCGKDSTYAICTSGPVAVWVLTGKHRRVPVVSLHADGPVEAAHASIATELPRALGAAHLNELYLVADWFGKQVGKETAAATIGDWLVDLSAEVDSEEPGVHLTLTDKFCKANCQAE